MKTALSLNHFILQALRPYKHYVFMFVFIALYWAINNALAPYILKIIIDTVVAHEGSRPEVWDAVRPYVLFYIALWIGIAFDMRLLDWVKLRLFPSIRQDLMNKMFDYLTGHSYRYFQNNFAGSLSNKIGDMHSGVITILTTLDDAFAQFLGLIVAIGMMLLVHPLFAVILLGWAVSFLCISYYFFRPIQNLSHIFSTTRTKVFGQWVDSISNIANIRLFSRNTYESQRIRDSVAEAVSQDRAMEWMIIKMRIFWDISIIVLISVNILLLVNMYQNNQVSIGDFSFIISLSISIFYNLWYLASQFVTFAEEAGKCKQALSIMEMPHEIVDKKEAKPLLVKEGQIEFHDVTFHYHEGVHLFKNKNIIIPARQKVGLVGFSGSGKSTFVNLILRLFDVESGQIRIDGQDIAAVTQNSLREQITMIPQDTTLFHRSLLENIRYGCVTASDEAVITASKMAHCHEFVSQLKEGYESLVGERGIKLSGGQRQRIAVARAMLKNAPILILDEATSALDSVTEKYIQDGLHTLMQDKTTIVIAHRLSTLSQMDRILVFNAGYIIEDGTHEELIQAKGHYAHMWQMQAGGFLPEQENNDS
ncbi:ABC transporter ATP-binding protein [Legionella longbeachae]|uniref:ABC transporter, ATP binding protein n=1 Tax=Legionella longbeachae serogroup 1 (strain NSW150) TaxID=661367 RepID=D3HSA0_LEGLN|nr:ABC transporter ATP-binding protein [Legionella longbeachae]VEE02283.1 ABC transporter ATP-binding protein [Legionella oakridgensis]HBD7398227.1 ABC transporter ATP-binding protein [Legionella pneumophila]ARB91425.1 ABC transporter ATP-binding protein [Legionella longbeachae]EEZ95079.1 ABC-type multidrug efflux pump [Legionella longbeachae D-4968]QIN32151.1 ATP-binding cassette domain-containing protein [Legionella longbeachae]